MSNVAQNIDARPSELHELPEPPPSEPRPRAKKPRRAKPTLTAVPPYPFETTEQKHERRIRERLAKERAELVENAQTYREVANEVESPSLSEQRLVVVLATAIGAHAGDPLTVLLEEIRIRCGTLMHMARSEHPSPDEVLESLAGELDMLQRRAEVAGELLRRFGGLSELCKSLREEE